MKSDTTFFLIAGLAIVLLSSCGSEDVSKENTSESSALIDTAQNKGTLEAPVFSAEQIEVKTFEVKDDSGKSLGWGYDILVDNKKMIHQPIIPAVPGNNSFKTEADAKKTGLLAVAKMKQTGSLPTLSVKELDSLGVTK